MKKSIILKLLLVCIMCAGIVYGAVLLFQHLFN